MLRHDVLENDGGCIWSRDANSKPIINFAYLVYPKDLMKIFILSKLKDYIKENVYRVYKAYWLNK